MTLIKPIGEQGTFGDPKLQPLPWDDEIIVQLFTTCAVASAAQLGLFKLLAAGPQTISEIANATGASETGTRVLAEALAAAGYLVRESGRFGNSAITRAWLTPASPVDFTPALVSFPMWLQMLAGIGDAVRAGQPQFNFYDYLPDHPQEAFAFSQHMKAKAILPSPLVAEATALPTVARRLLDVGGSHGLYSMAFCRQYPNLSAVVFDMPMSLVETERIAAAAGLADRISVQRGDFFSDDLGNGYDVVLLSHILHNNPEEQNKKLLAKVAQALHQGGHIVVHDWLWDEPPSTPVACFSLMLFMVAGTRAYREREITGWLAEAGFGSFRRTDLTTVGMSSVITGVKAE